MKKHLDIFRMKNLIPEDPDARFKMKATCKKNS